MNDNLSHKINRKFEMLEKSITSHQIVSSVASTDEAFAKSISNCKTVEQLGEKLANVGLKKEDVERDYFGYYCEVCFDNTKPNWKNLHGSSGAFLFNSKEDCDESSGNQSRVFRNLKTNIKSHLERKSHRLKLEILRKK